MNHLEQVLASMPEGIDWPEPSPHMAGRVRARIEAGERESLPLRRWLWVAATVTVLMIALVPGTRHAVADLIIEAGVRIGIIEETPAELAADLELGEAVILEDATVSVDFSVRVPDHLGAPAAVYVGNGRVSMVWPGSESLPAAEDSDVGVLLTQGESDAPYAVKGIGPETRVENVVVGGNPGLWIAGAEHTFTLTDAQGEPIEMTTRLAANVLLWTADGIDYRLELTGDLEQSLAIAESLDEFPP